MIDEHEKINDIHDNLHFSNFPPGRVGHPVKHVRDGVIKSGTLLNLSLDPSRTHLLHGIELYDEETLQNARKFVKFKDDVDVSSIPQTTEDCITQY